MTRKILILIFTLTIIFSCNNDQNDSNSLNKGNVNSNNTKKVSIDDYAKFISGIKTQKFSDIQEKNFYKNYSKSIETTWNYFYLNQLLLITKWSTNHKLISELDTISVFYPFSGPDFPFVYSFYPYANKYLMLGLENIGEIPDFQKYSDIEIERYINSLSNSLTDFFHDGYFSTQNMKFSFRSENMNGVVHPLLFFITRSGNKIEKLQFFIIDPYGRMKIVKNLKRTDQEIKGLYISFTGKNGHKDLYYLQVDLSDQNFVNHPELITFISNFEEKNIFIKSASYLLQDENFSFFRKFLISQAVKIIQDDSGFGYDFLKKSNYDISLFGNYSHTLNIFEKYWQPELKKAYDKIKDHKLPFRFGYNIPFDETSLIFAYKIAPKEVQYPIYKIQIKMSWNKLSNDSFPESLQPIDYYYDEGYYKYTSGNYHNLQQTQKQLELAKKEGFKDAFIIEINRNSRKIIK